MQGHAVRMYLISGGEIQIFNDVLAARGESLLPWPCPDESSHLLAPVLCAARDGSTLPKEGQWRPIGHIGATSLGIFPCNCSFSRSPFPLNCGKAEPGKALENSSHLRAWASFIHPTEHFWQQIRHPKLNFNLRPESQSSEEQPHASAEGYVYG